jgi:hypothetical protein
MVANETEKRRHRAVAAERRGSRRLKSVEKRLERDRVRSDRKQRHRHVSSIAMG